MKPYNKANATKSEEVREMFDNIAPTYDKLNHILSLNIDRVWRGNVVKIATKSSPAHILDVATGTGDLAIALARKNTTAKIVGADPSGGMLKVAEQKVKALELDKTIELKQTNAEVMAFDSESFDVVTVAFGVRNFGDLKGGISEMMRVLRPGGKLIVLEFAACKTPLVAPLYRFYSHKVMPRIGALLSKDKSAYTYLPESIEEFLAPKEFLSVMSECGAVNCYNRPQFFGVAHIYVGEKK